MPMTASDALEAVAEIERNTPDQIKSLRTHSRVTVRAKVIAQPGNASQRSSFKAEGVLGDISPGGCLVLFSTPLCVGDIYRLVIDKTALNIEPTYAKCLRCRMIREEAFEAGFSFFQPVDLANVAQDSSKSESLFD